VVLTPWLSDKTREQRRQHILTSAWRCFSRDGFHATSLEDVIAATGMSFGAVYRYFRGKEIIRASALRGFKDLGGRRLISARAPALPGSLRQRR
jgi:AcrR family transcriptional regulator